MIKGDNEITIQNNIYRLVVQGKNSHLFVSLMVFAQSFSRYKYYEGSMNYKSASGNIQNERKLVKCLLRYLQEQELYKVDIKNRKLIFPQIKGSNGIKKSLEIQLQQKFKNQKQILIQQFKRRQYHHSVFQQKSYEYLDIINKKFNFMKKTIDRQNKKIRSLQKQRKQQGLKVKKLKLDKKRQEQEQEQKMNEQQDNIKQKQKQKQLKSYINNRNRLYFQKANIQQKINASLCKNQEIVDKQKKQTKTQQNIIQFNDQIQPLNNFVQSKWTVISQYLDKFTLNGNLVKHEVDQWNNIIMNVPFKNTKEDKSFTIRILKLKQNYIMIGLVSTKGKKSKCNNYQLTQMKNKGYYQYTCPENNKYFIGGFHQGDQVKVTIKYQYKVVDWALNGVVFASQIVKNINQQFYPCIEMYSKDDVIQWLQ